MKTSEAHAILLAAAMESDLLVKSEEIEAGRRILSRAAKERNEEMADWGAAVGGHGSVDEAISELKSQPEAFRQSLVADLWEISFSDGEVHIDERAFVVRVAKLLDVPHLSKDSWPIPTSS